MIHNSIIYDNPNLEIIEEKIWVIHNFVKKEESEVYLDFANSATEEEWWKENSGWYQGKYLNALVDPKINKLSNIITTRFSCLFKFGGKLSYGTPGSIHRMTQGQEMFVHADFSEVDDSDDEIILFNTAIYHNDVPGGEIYYPEIGVEYHPTQGDLVIHPGTTKYRHGVKPVTKETRYISTLWAANEKGMKIKTSGQMSTSKTNE
jgi:hypothetical protein